jgi:hypothetical protein
MKIRPVHNYMALVRCPDCRYYYMLEGDERCPHCQGRLLASLGQAETHEERVAAIQRAREARILEEDTYGSVGSLPGLGFEALSPRAIDSPEERPGGLGIPGTVMLVIAVLLLLMAMLSGDRYGGPTISRSPTCRATEW